MIALGVPAGNRIPCMKTDSWFANPASAMVGTSGNACARLLSVTASARSLPSFMFAAAAGNETKQRGVCPQFAVLQVCGGGGQRDEAEGRVPADGRRDGGHSTVERHVHEIETERKLEQLARQMRRLPGPRRCVAVFSGVRLHHSDEIG